ncbi:MAG: diaminopimelate epimerase [Alphaproteobacteria bacterium]
MTDVPFTKMHGLGNDFVVIDARDRLIALKPATVRAIAARHTGVGCDQLIVMEPAADGTAVDVFMRIYNADGGEVDACGNATRCVAKLLIGSHGQGSVRIATGGGVLVAEHAAGDAVSVDMGPPGLGWRDIPLASKADTLHLEITSGPLSDPAAVGMGNPHCVFFVDDLDAIPMEALGPELEHHDLFPERANIGVAQIIDDMTLCLRVWERGVGLTLACGTGACAAAVSAHRRGLTGRRVGVQVDGGTLAIEWRADDHVIMTGPAAVSFTGALAPDLFA